MPAQYEEWSEAVEAVDAFERTERRSSNIITVIFGGTASPAQDDNTDILTSRAIQQRVLDLLDEPTEG
ncbi:MAG TPA: hypothetical protein DCK99_09745 [Blastocatellia bacterium]|nr:hypothetical protein [Blastocatellia bacterium]